MSLRDEWIASTFWGVIAEGTVRFGAATFVWYGCLAALFGTGYGEDVVILVGTFLPVYVLADVVVPDGAAST